MSDALRYDIVPASLVSVLVSTAGLMFVRLTLTGRLGVILGEGILGAENWAALAPELLWPPRRTPSQA